MAGPQELCMYDGTRWNFVPRSLVLLQINVGKLVYLDCSEQEAAEIMSYLKKLGIIINMYVLPLSMPIANVDATMHVSHDRPWRTDVKAVYALLRVK